MKNLILLAAFALTVPAVASAQINAPTMVGTMNRADFDSLNAQSATMIEMITPSGRPMSAKDQALMVEIVDGGGMQLRMAEAALPRLTHPEARVLAQSEAEEQVLIGQKLQEIATASNVTLPPALSESIVAAVKKFDKLDGVLLDVFYLRKSGDKGHQALEATMVKVNAQAQDPALKSLAAATLPVIRAHMQVSRDIIAGLSTSTAKE